MFKVPILLLTFKRPLETKKVLEQILSINPKTLYVFQDGKKNDFNKKDHSLHNQTSKIITNYQNLKCIKYIKYKKNIGHRYIAKILDIVFKKEKEIIFLEDDTFPNKSFFKFCEVLLKKYKNDSRVYHISGCNLFNGTTKKRLTDKSIIFSKYPQFWGWATWKKKWNKLYDPKISDWNKNKRKFLKKFKYNEDEKRYFKFYIENNSKGKHIGWDVPWIYKLILHNKITVITSVNLIKNIGFKSNPNGIGAKKFRNLKISNLKFPLKMEKKVNPNYEYDDFLRKSFYHRKTIFIRILNRILRYL